MKTSQRTLITAALVVILCALFVAGISAAPAAPNGPVTINKAVSPQIIEPTYAGVLTYTITLTSDETVENAIMTDTLPTALSFGEWVTQSGAINVGDTITWTGHISAETSLDFVFTAQVPGPETLQGLIGEGIVNTASLGYLSNTVILPDSFAQATTRFYRYLFLPLVMRNFAQ